MQLKLPRMTATQKAIHALQQKIDGVRHSARWRKGTRIHTMHLEARATAESKLEKAVPEDHATIKTTPKVFCGELSEENLKAHDMMTAEISSDDLQVELDDDECSCALSQ